MVWAKTQDAKLELLNSPKTNSLKSSALIVAAIWGYK